MSRPATSRTRPRPSVSTHVKARMIFVPSIIAFGVLLLARAVAGTGLAVWRFRWR